MVEVFGIPMIATNKFKKSGKLNHVASIMAELLDNDNDGCADDPNVLQNLRAKTTKKSAIGIKGLTKAFYLPNDYPISDKSREAAMEKKIWFRQSVSFFEVEPTCSGLNFSNACTDSSVEEIYHFVTSEGHVLAYPKTFGITWKSKSDLTKAMDIAR